VVKSIDNVAGCQIDKRAASQASIVVVVEVSSTKTPSTGLVAPRPVASISSSFPLTRDPSSQFPRSRMVSAPGGHSRCEI
jgi:hypothetical protein